MLGREAQHEVGVQQLALVAGLLILVQAGKRFPVCGTAHGEGPRTFPVRNPAVPVELHPALLLEGRNYFAQFRVHSAAVIALIVVLEKDLPVRFYLIPDPAGDPQFRERIAFDPIDSSAELCRQRASRLSRRFRPSRAQSHKHEAAPHIHFHRIEGSCSFEIRTFIENGAVRRARSAEVQEW